MMNILNDLARISSLNFKNNSQFFKRLKKKPPKKLDQLMLQLHEDQFSKIDCLECANCCKTTSPIFTNRDISRISKYLKMKQSNFVSKYLHLDSDNDYILNSSPCIFLANDNTCNIYNVRPKACSEYPHTNRKDFHKIADLTMKNIEICPAAYKIVEKLKISLSKY